MADSCNNALADSGEEAGVMYEKSAIISKCGLYRYELRRIWNPKKGLVCWVMLNPSTADGNFDDPTIRRCIGYTMRWGYGGIVVVNLFALRATSPRDLHESCEPIGPENDKYIIRASEEAVVTIVAWGNKGKYLNRDDFVMALIILPCHLALTKNGSPRHPLYLRSELQPISMKEGKE